MRSSPCGKGYEDKKAYMSGSHLHRGKLGYWRREGGMNIRRDCQEITRGNETVLQDKRQISFYGGTFFGFNDYILHYGNFHFSS